MASVTPRANRDGSTSWRVQFRVDGKMLQETFPDHKGADDFGKLVDRVGGKEAREINDRRQTPDHALTLREWTTLYLDPDSGVVTGIQPGTRATYRQIAESSFLPMLGEIPVDALNKRDIGQWVAWQEAQPSRRGRKEPDPDGPRISAKTMHNYHALLSNILKVAVEEGMRPDNPAHRTRLSEGLSREGVFLSPNEFARLLKAIPEQYRPLVLFLVFTQTRWSEATAVTWGDIHLETDPPTIRINKAWKKNPGGSPVLSAPKSAKARRTIAVWPELLAALGEPGAPDELLFRGQMSGNQVWYSSFNARIWRPSVKKANLGKSPNIHDLRHTGASWLIADNRPLPFIQQRLGHEDIRTTISVYGHLLPDAHTSMVSTLSGIMSSVLPIGVKEISAGTDPDGAPSE